MLYTGLLLLLISLGGIAVIWLAAQATSRRTLECTIFRSLKEGPQTYQTLYAWHGLPRDKTLAVLRLWMADGYIAPLGFTTDENLQAYQLVPAKEAELAYRLRPRT